MADQKPEMDYDQAKRMAASGAVDDRRRVAGHTGTRPEILYFLANDTNADVRLAIAGNTSTPRQADLLLSQDPDVRVRSGLAAKISALVPTATADRVEQLERMALQILETLARDQAVEVRRVIAEALQDVAGAPPAVIQTLARDLEESVCGPVLRNSPVLTDEDLLEIIRGHPADEKLIAIAGRAGVSGVIADAIARTENEVAIAGLLGNASAQIREETLDRLVELAPRHEPWHGPLVRRPALPARAAERLAGFVAETLLEVLRNRSDLPAETRAAVSRAVEQRLAPPGPRAQTAAEERGGERPSDKAKRLLKEGKLDEDAIDEALDQGDRGLAIAGLALLSKLPSDVVDRILSGQSPRGVTALVWKASLSARFARKAQLRLAHIPPASVLAPRGDRFPMTEAEMKWQLEFFGARL
jgi:uncharacterized protein (DUF2336 family)